jgi:hypothetical protein
MNHFLAILKRWGRYGLALVLLAGLATAELSCAGGQNKGRSHKKLKRGKPIPCPIKDC